MVAKQMQSSWTKSERARLLPGWLAGGLGLGGGGAWLLRTNMTETDTNAHDRVVSLSHQTNLRK